MREIKFRVWYLEENRYITISPSLLHKEFVGTNEKGQLVFNVRDYVWEQYTGLKDKNGVEIYEGDRYTYMYAERYGNDSIEEILKNPAEHLLSKETAIARMGMDKDDTHCDDDFYSTRTFNIEVIGNIHD